MGTVEINEQRASEVHLTQMTADVVSAYVGGNPVQASDLSKLIADVHQALMKLDDAAVAQEAKKPEPAVNPKRSIKPDQIICLECGLAFKSLKRHIGSKHGLTPAEYREKWGLPADYPMVAPEYSTQRSELARDMGLGRKPGQKPRKKK